MNDFYQNKSVTIIDALDKTLQVLRDHELRQIKTDLHRFYLNECIRLGSSRKVPKTVIRPCAINQLTANKIISSNVEWFKKTVELLKKMQNEKKK